MTMNPVESDPNEQDDPSAPEPDPDEVRTDIPGVDPDWPQTAQPGS